MKGRRRNWPGMRLMLSYCVKHIHTNDAEYYYLHSTTVSPGEPDSVSSPLGPAPPPAVMSCNVKRQFIQCILAKASNVLQTLVLREEECFEKTAKNTSTVRSVA